MGCFIDVCNIVNSVEQCLGIWTKPTDGTRCESLCIRPAMVQMIRLVQRQGQADLPRVTESLMDFLNLAQAKISGNIDVVPPSPSCASYKWFDHNKLN